MNRDGGVWGRTQVHKEVEVKVVYWRDQAESWSGTGRRSYQSRGQGSKPGKPMDITPKPEGGARKQNWEAKDNKQKRKLINIQTKQGRKAQKSRIKDE